MEVVKAESGLEMGSNEVKLDEEFIIRRAAELQQKRQQVLNQRVNALINGDEEPPNEFVAYEIERLRTCQAEMERLRRTAQQLSGQLQQVEQRLAVLSGEHAAHVQGLRHWDFPSAEKKID